MATSFAGRWLPLAFLAIGGAIGPLWPQEVEEAPERRLDAEEVTELRDQTAANTAIDADIRQQAVTLYDEALDAIEAAEASANRAESFRREAAGIPAAVEALREQLSAILATDDFDLPEGASADQLDTLLTQERTALEAALESLRSIEQLADERSARRTDIARRLGLLDKQIEGLADQLRSTTASEIHPEVGRALRRNILARRVAALAERDALRAQLALFEARGALIPWQRDQAQRRLEFLTGVVEILEQVTLERRHEEDQQSLEAIRALGRKAVELDPGFEKFATETEGYAERMWGVDGIVAKLDETSRKLTDTRKHITELDRITELTQRQLAAVGRGGSSSQWWPKIPEGYPTLAEMEREIEERERLIPEVQHELILLEEQRAEITDLGIRAADYVRSTIADSGRRDEVTGVVRELLFARRDLIDDLTQAYERYSNQLVELDTLTRGLYGDGVRIRGAL
jgi:hypothetical protein